MKTTRTISGFGALALCAVLAACGGQEVSNEAPIQGNGTPTQPTPTPEPTPEPTPITYRYRVTLTNIHVYDNAEPFGNGELYFTFAVNDTVAYSNQISAADNSDYVPSQYGVTPIDVDVLEGDPVYIYVNGYDDDSPAGNDPMGTVNYGWNASGEIVGTHSASAQDPYNYDVTYRIELR